MRIRLGWKGWPMCGDEAGRKELCKDLRASWNASCREEVHLKESQSLCNRKGEASAAVSHIQNSSLNPTPPGFVYESKRKQWG